MLYDRDYNILTEEETKQWGNAESIFKKSRIRAITPAMMKRYYKTIPHAALHHRELFPNNYLNTTDLDDKSRIEEAIKKLKDLLDSGTKERDILNLIKGYMYYFIVGSIFHCGITPLQFRFGHHNAFLFKEFPLGTNYVADYLLVGKNSGGYEFIFVEFESPSGAITTKDGEFGDCIRKGIAQVNDWNRWLIANFASLQSEFEKHLGIHDRNLPKEFYKLDETRLHYVIVAGRRSDYNEKTYTIRRELFQKTNITLIHYDNLLDATEWLSKSGNY